MVATVSVLVPWPEQVVASATKLAPRLSSLGGMRLGIVDNGWHCMNVITDLYAEMFGQRFGVAEVVVKRTSGSLTMSAADRADLQDRCDAVVVGIGTCGSCTQWVVKDAVEMERSGTPTVSLYTRSFEVLATTLATSDAMPDLPRVVLPHPLNPLPDEEIRAAAGLSVESVVAALTGAGVAG